MLLLIDGYNLLKTMEPAAVKSNRDAFIALLNAYAKRKRHHVMVVFDAGPTTDPFKERHGDITVFYSGAQTADEIIQELLDVYEEQKNIVLISSDMQLKHYAKLRMVASIDSEIFAHFLAERKKVRQKVAPSLNGRAHKFERDAEPELDQLMTREMQFTKQDDDAAEMDSKQERLKELAGNDKKLISILKKL